MSKCLIACAVIVGVVAELHVGSLLLEKLEAECKAKQDDELYKNYEREKRVYQQCKENLLINSYDQQRLSGNRTVNETIQLMCSKRLELEGCVKRFLIVASSYCLPEIDNGTVMDNINKLIKVYGKSNDYICGNSGESYVKLFEGMNSSCFLSRISNLQLCLMNNVVNSFDFTIVFNGTEICDAANAMLQCATSIKQLCFDTDSRFILFDLDAMMMDEVPHCLTRGNPYNNRILG